MLLTAATLALTAGAVQALCSALEGVHTSAELRAKVRAKGRAVDELGGTWWYMVVHGGTWW